MTVEPFTKNGGLVIFVTVGDRHQPRVRGESVVFGGGLHDPLLNSLVFPNWRNIAITLTDGRMVIPQVYESASAGPSGIHQRNRKYRAAVALDLLDCYTHPLHSE